MLRVRAFLFGLAAFSLLCTGVHAAADVLDDRIAAGVEVIDSAFDALLGRFEWTRPLCDVVDSELITRVGRAVALIWELVLDLLLGAQVFRHERHELDRERLRAVLQQVLRETRRLRITGPKPAIVFLRPLFAAIFVLTGAAAVGRLTQGGVTLSLRHSLPGVAAALGQISGIAVLGACLAVLGIDAILAAFVRARDERRGARLLLPPARMEIYVALCAAPLAWLALSEALSLGAFLR